MVIFILISPVFDISIFKIINNYIFNWLPDSKN